jgi:hypothetical protein
LTAKGYLPARTNLTVPDYGEVTWSVAMENLPRLRIQTTPSVPFTLLNEGQPVSGEGGAYEFELGRPLKLLLRSKGFEPATTNLVLPNHGEVTWLVALTRLPTPSPNQPWTNTLGMQFVPVPGTAVLFGVWDVRVKDYREYARANSGVNNKWQKLGFTQGDDHPVVNVSWEDAKAFCAWLTEKERREGKLSVSQSYRLPLDWEWCVGVGLNETKGGTPMDKNMKIKDVYPWGTSWPPPKGAGNYDSSLSVDSYPNTSPVGSFKANQYGLYDMGGNVWQWCEDEFTTVSGYHVLRGAPWDRGSVDYLLSSCRRNGGPHGRGNGIGFRCVLVGGSAP